MYIKTFIAALIVSLIVSTAAYFINLYTPLPQQAYVYFAVGLVASFLTSLWVNKTPDSLEHKKPRSRRKTGKATGRSKDKPAASASDNASKETGSVKWFSPSKGFGFITRDNGEDIFVHFRSIMGKGHRVLREGQRVEFAVTQGSKGLQAEEVNTIG